jgi:hypothetical protein
MKLTEIENGDYEIAWASPEIDHGDWPFRFLLRIQYCEEWCPEWAERGKYYATIESVSPAAAGEENCRRACESQGLSYEEQFLTFGTDIQAKIVSDYGIKAVLWQEQGNNFKKLKKEMLEKLREKDFFFGFAMDQAQNRIGSTGWDLIKGDLLAGLNRQPDMTNRS